MYYVPLAHIRPNPWQPRQTTDTEHIHSLADDIYSRRHVNSATKGLLQIPIARLVDEHNTPFPARQVGGMLADIQKNTASYTDWTEGIYIQLAFGHSRIEAFRQLHATYPHEQFHIVPVELVIWNDEEMATAAWSENASRKDLNPAEEAMAIQKMMTDFGWTQDKAATYLNLNRSTIANKLRLLKLSAPVLDQLRQGQLSERQAMALLHLEALPPAIHADIDVVEFATQAAHMSSDEIRRTTETIVRQNTWSLSNWRGTSFPLDTPIHGEGEEVGAIVVPVCTTCSNFIKGSDPRCPIRDCIEAKAKSHHIRSLQPVAEDLKLPIAYAGAGYPTHEGIRTPELVSYALEQQCPRVELTRQGYGCHPFPDHPDIVLLCHHGAGKQCTCQTAMSRAATKAATGGRTLAEARKVYEGQILIPAAELFAQALANNEVGAWRALLRVLEGYRATSPNREEVAAFQLAVAQRVLQDGFYEPWRDLEQARHRITTNLLNADLQAPWYTEA